jgi:Zn-dependent protease
MTCPQCGAEIPPNTLACPSCRGLIHAAELKALAAQADAATAVGNFSEALVHWRRALELLPRGSAQFLAINAKVNDLVQRLESPTAAEVPKKPGWANRGGLIGVVGLVLWKFKFILVFVLTKAKLLLLGLTKASTLFSMLLSLGVYWSIWGWKLALGLIVSIYIHEMGHVYQLTRYGIKATAPMFIPGLGAVIRQKQYPASPHEDARVGLAGPVWGLFAAGAAYVIHLLTGYQIYAAIAQWGAIINLFNLLPVWQLDGSHAFRALSKLERAGIAAIAAAMGMITGEGWLIIITIVAAFRAFGNDAPKERNLPIFSEFAFLVVTLSLLTQIPVDLRRHRTAEPQLAISAETRTFVEVAKSFGPFPGSPKQMSLLPR